MAVALTIIFVLLILVAIGLLVKGYQTIQKGIDEEMAANYPPGHHYIDTPKKPDWFQVFIDMIKTGFKKMNKAGAQPYEKRQGFGSVLFGSGMLLLTAGIIGVIPSAITAAAGAGSGSDTTTTTTTSPSSSVSVTQTS